MNQWMNENTIVIKFFIHKNVYVIYSVELGWWLDGSLIGINIDITICT